MALVARVRCQGRGGDSSSMLRAEEPAMRMGIPWHAQTRSSWGPAMHQPHGCMRDFWRTMQLHVPEEPVSRKP